MYEHTAVGLIWVRINNISSSKADYDMELNDQNMDGSISLEENEIKMFRKLAEKIEKRMVKRIESSIQKARIGGV